MEKYGVLQDGDTARPAEKTAEEKGPRCRGCNRPLAPRALTGVLYCSVCGTKPYEER